MSLSVVAIGCFVLGYLARVAQARWFRSASSGSDKVPIFNPMNDDRI